MRAKVYLVDGGSEDPDLLTRKAHQADIYRVHLSHARTAAVIVHSLLAAGRPPMESATWSEAAAC